MKYTTILAQQHHDFYKISLNRPEVKNAFNEIMIAELTHVFQNLPTTIKGVVIDSTSDTFCSGGDLNWMKDSLNFTHEENYEDATKLSQMFQVINECAYPVIGAIKRFALGGGVGLVSVCDYVIAEKNTKFSLSEVKLGLIPACIGPYVLAKIGESWCRALFLSANRFSAEQAQQIGLIHEIASDENTLKERVHTMIEQISSCSPQAVRVAKQFLRHLKNKEAKEQNEIAGKTLADIRITPEAQEGLHAFLEKRSPKW